MPERTLSVFKYTSALADTISFDLPKHAHILKFGVQNHQICVWALVNTNETKTDRRSFRVFGTGHDIPKTGVSKYVDTVFDDSYVWHIFYVHDDDCTTDC